MTNNEIKILVEKIFDLKISGGEDTKILIVKEEESQENIFCDLDDNINDGDPPLGF